MGSIPLEAEKHSSLLRRIAQSNNFSRQTLRFCHEGVKKTLMYSLPVFLKKGLLKICPFSPERHRHRGFKTPNNPETRRERKEKGGEGGEKKKGLVALNLHIAYFGDSF